MDDFGYKKTEEIEDEKTIEPEYNNLQANLKEFVADLLTILYAMDKLGL